MYIRSATPQPITSTTPKWHGREYGDYYYYDGGPWKDWDWKMRYDYIIEENTRKQTMDTTETIDYIFSFLGLFLNLIHLFVLSRKDLRSGVVFIIMIGICLSDILVSSSSITESYCGNSADIFFEEGRCGKDLQYWFTVIELVSQAVQKFGKFTSASLTLFMTLIRTISVLFPMGSLSAFLMKPKTGIFIGVGTGLFFMTWCIQYYRYYRFVLNSRICYEFISYDLTNMSQMQYVLEGCTLVALSVIYMLVTVTLLIALRIVKRRKKSLGTAKSDNTSTLVVTMAILFFISVLFFSTVHILGNWSFGNDINKLSSMLKYAANSVLKLNSILHCLICFLMSSQYREVVKKLIGFDKWNMKRTKDSSNAEGATTASRS